MPGVVLQVDGEAQHAGLRLPQRVGHAHGGGEEHEEGGGEDAQLKHHVLAHLRVRAHGLAVLRQSVHLLSLEVVQVA